MRQIPVSLPHLYLYRNTVNCPVSNHFYFKADSKYLLRGNKISAFTIPLNNKLSFRSYNDFEVDRQLS